MPFLAPRRLIGSLNRLGKFDNRIYFKLICPLKIKNKTILRLFSLLHSICKATVKVANYRTVPCCTVTSNGNGTVTVTLQKNPATQNIFTNIPTKN